MTGLERSWATEPPGRPLRHFLLHLPVELSDLKPPRCPRVKIKGGPFECISANQKPVIQGPTSRRHFHETCQKYRQSARGARRLFWEPARVGGRSGHE